MITKKRIKKYFSNFIFFILMMLSSFILIPLFIVFFIAYLLFIPIEYVIYKHYKNVYEKVFAYMPMFMIIYKKTISLIKTFSKTEFIYDTEKKVFIYERKCYIIKQGNKFEIFSKKDLKGLEDYIFQKYNIKLLEIIYE